MQTRSKTPPSSKKRNEKKKDDKEENEKDKVAARPQSEEPVDGNGGGGSSSSKSNASPKSKKQPGATSSSSSSSEEKDDDDENATLKAAKSLSLSLNQKALLTDMESSYLAMKSEREDLRSTVQFQSDQIKSLRSELLSLQQEQQTTTSKNDKEEEELSNLRSENKELQRKLTSSTLSAESNTERLRESKLECSNLQAALATLESRNTSLLSTLNSLSSSGGGSGDGDGDDAAGGSEVALRYELNRWKKECDSAQSHMQWLEGELERRNEEMKQVQLKLGKEVRMLKKELQGTKVDREDLEEEEKRRRTELNEGRDRLERAKADLRRMEIEMSDMERLHEEELVAERRLNELTKERLENLQERYEGLGNEMEQVKRDSEQMMGQLREELERVRTDCEDKAKQALKSQEDEYNAVVLDLETKLKEAEDARKRIEDDLLGRTPTPIKKRRLQNDESEVVAVVDDEQQEQGQDPDPQEQHLTLTELYEKLTTTQDLLLAEKTQRKRAELFLERTRLDIERRTPKLQTQKLEYERAVKKAKEFKLRLDEAWVERDIARDEVRSVRDEVRRREEEGEELKRENQDLAEQVKLLLKRRMGVDDGGTDVVDDLVGFGSVDELQSQNQRLLKEHHNLTNTVAQLEEQIENDHTRNKLEDALEQLDKIKEERTRQETLVSGIVQQRDLYRALLSKQNAQQDTNEQALTVTAEQAIVTTSTNHEQTITKLRTDLTTLQHTNTLLENRLERLDAHSTELSSSQDSLRLQLSVSNAEKARSEADAKYHSDKCTRLEQTINDLKNENSKLVEAKQELVRVNDELEKVLEGVRTDNSLLEKKSHQIQTKLRLNETTLLTTQSSERRLSSENTSLRSELNRQSALLESIRRIEASLDAKNQELAQKKEDDFKRDMLKLEVEKADLIKEKEKMEEKITDFEVKVGELEEKRGTLLEELVAVKGDLSKFMDEARLAKEKLVKSEEELGDARSKLDVFSDEAHLLDKISSLETDLESVRTELLSSKDRMEDYQNIAKTNEKALTDLTKASNQYKAGKEDELKTLQSKLQDSQRTVESRQQMLDVISKDLANQRDEQQKEVKDLTTQLKTAQTELKGAKNDAKVAIDKLGAFKKEMEDVKTSMKATQNNYERELALHSTARTALRTARDKTEAEVNRRQSLETELETVKDQACAEMRSLQESKAKIEEESEKVQSRLKEYKDQNNVLHSQMKTLTETIEKLQNDRVEAVVEKSSETVGETTDEEDIKTLQKTISELREVLRFTRSEKEMVDVQLQSAKRAADREKAAAAISKRSLEEARAELTVLTKSRDEEKDADADGVDTSDKLKKAEEQLTLLHESNVLLREESERASKKLAVVQKELEESMNAVNAAETVKRDAVVQTATFRAEKESLEREVEAWKVRVQSLVSKFNQIDPEEHSKALKRAETAEKECSSIKTQLQRAEKECLGAKSVLTRLNKEISLQKAQVESTTKALAKAKAEKEALTQSNAASGSAVKKEVEQLKDLVKTMQVELQKKDGELVTTKTRLENLQKILRKNKAAVEDLMKQKNKALEGEQEAKKALVKELEAKKGLAKEHRAALVKVQEVQVALTTKENQSASLPERRATTATGSAGEPRNDPSSSKQQVVSSKELPKVPQGGFKFAPSGSSTTSTTATVTTKSDTSSKAKAGDASLPGTVPSSTASATTTTPTPSVVTSKSTDTKASAIEKEGPASATAVGTAASKIVQSKDEKEESLRMMREKLMKKKRHLGAIIGKTSGATSQQPPPKRPTSPTRGISPHFSPRLSPKDPPPASTNKAPDSVASSTVSSSAPKSSSGRLGATSKAAVASKADKGASNDEGKEKVVLPSDGTSEGGKKDSKDASLDTKPPASSGPITSLSFPSSNATIGGGGGVTPTFGATTAMSLSKKTPTGGIFGGGKMLPTKPTNTTSRDSPVPSSFGAAAIAAASAARSAKASSASSTTASAASKTMPPSTTFGSGSAFLNLKPPGSSPATSLVFGSPAGIKLPMPSVQTLTPTTIQSPFGTVAQPGESGVTSTPTTKKRPLSFMEDVRTKQQRVGGEGGMGTVTEKEEGKSADTAAVVANSGVDGKEGGESTSETNA